MNDLERTILILFYKGIFNEANSFQICRYLNGRDLSDCREARDLAKTFSSYKRYGHREACKYCKYPYSKIQRALLSLTKKGYLIKTKVKVEDPYCLRKWDIHNIYKLNKDILK